MKPEVNSTFSINKGSLYLLEPQPKVIIKPKSKMMNLTNKIYYNLATIKVKIFEKKKLEAMKVKISLAEYKNRLKVKIYKRVNTPLKKKNITMRNYVK